MSAAEFVGCVLVGIVFAALMAHGLGVLFHG